MNYINSYCRIVQNSVIVNGITVFESAINNISMKDFLSQVYDNMQIEYRKFFKMDILSKLGFLASEYTLAGFDREKPKQEIAIVFFNRSSSLEADYEYQKTIADDNYFFPSPSEFVYTLPNIVTGEIAIRNKIFGETAFYILPKYDATVMFNHANDILLDEDVKYVLLGWVEVDPFDNVIDCITLLCSNNIKGEMQLSVNNLNELYFKNKYS